MSIFKLIKPSFYAQEYAAFIGRLRKETAAGSGAPLFKAMLLVGVTGYSMEYSMVGSKLLTRKTYEAYLQIILNPILFVESVEAIFNKLFLAGHHVAERQAIIKEAMKNHHH